MLVLPYVAVCVWGVVVGDVVGAVVAYVVVLGCALTVVVCFECVAC